MSGPRGTIAFNATFDYDFFLETLNDNEKLILALIEPGIFLCETEFIVHVKDHAQRTILILTLIPGIPRRTKTIIQMAGSSGQTLLTAKGFSISSLEVWSGSGANEQLLGRLDDSICSTGLKVLDNRSEVLFNVDSGVCCCRVPSEFSLISNGVTLARVGKSETGTVDGEISFLDTRHIDQRTKTFIILAGYYVYIPYFANTKCGRIGIHGLSKRIQYFGFTVFLVIVLSVMSFLYIYTRT